MVPILPSFNLSSKLSILQTDSQKFLLFYLMIMPLVIVPRQGRINYEKIYFTCGDLNFMPIVR